MVRLRTPGPGAYETPSHLTISGSMGGRPTASFASNSHRANKVSSRDSSGDPGAYDIERSGVHLGKKEPMSARTRRSFNRDVNGGRGSFNSTTQRSSSAPPRSTRGGPGEHDYSHMYACGNSSTQVTSSFLSAMPLGGHVRKSETRTRGGDRLCRLRGVLQRNALAPRASRRVAPRLVSRVPRQRASANTSPTWWQARASLERAARCLRAL